MFQDLQLVLTKMKKKILSFVVFEGEFLALRNNPHPDHGGDFWFVVTGGVGNETLLNAVRREVFEETGLTVEDVFSLNCGSIYEWNSELYEEMNFVSFVNSKNVILNEENIEFKWLKLNEFIKLIRWEDDKSLLKNVLKKALNKDVYFDKRFIKNYCGVKK